MRLCVFLFVLLTHIIKIKTLEEDLKQNIRSFASSSGHNKYNSILPNAKSLISDDFLNKRLKRWTPAPQLENYDNNEEYVWMGDHEDISNCKKSEKSWAKVIINNLDQTESVIKFIQSGSTSSKRDKNIFIEFFKMAVSKNGNKFEKSFNNLNTMVLNIVSNEIQKHNLRKKDESWLQQIVKPILTEIERQFTNTKILNENAETEYLWIFQPEYLRIYVQEWVKQMVQKIQEYSKQNKDYFNNIFYNPVEVNLWVSQFMKLVEENHGKNEHNKRSKNENLKNPDIEPNERRDDPYYELQIMYLIESQKYKKPNRQKVELIILDELFQEMRKLNIKIQPKEDNKTGLVSIMKWILKQIMQKHPVPSSQSEEDTFMSWLATPNQYRVWVKRFANVAAKKIHENINKNKIKGIIKPIWQVDNLDEVNETPLDPYYDLKLKLLDEMREYKEPNRQEVMLIILDELFQEMKKLNIKIPPEEASTIGLLETISWIGQNTKKKHPVLSSQPDGEIFKSWVISPNQYREWVKKFANIAAKKIYENINKKEIKGESKPFWVDNDLDELNETPLGPYYNLKLKLLDEMREYKEPNQQEVILIILDELFYEMRKLNITIPPEENSTTGLLETISWIGRNTKKKHPVLSSQPDGEIVKYWVVSPDQYREWVNFFANIAAKKIYENINRNEIKGESKPFWVDNDLDELNETPLGPYYNLKLKLLDEMREYDQTAPNRQEVILIILDELFQEMRKLNIEIPPEENSTTRLLETINWIRRNTKKKHPVLSSQPDGEIFKSWIVSPIQYREWVKMYANKAAKTIYENINKNKIKGVSKAFWVDDDLDELNETPLDPYYDLNLRLLAEIRKNNDPNKQEIELIILDELLYEMKKLNIKIPTEGDITTWLLKTVRWILEQIKQNHTVTNFKSDEDAYKSWLSTLNQFKIMVQTFVYPAAKNIKELINKNNNVDERPDWIRFYKRDPYQDLKSELLTEIQKYKEPYRQKIEIIILDKLFEEMKKLDIKLPNEIDKTRFQKIVKWIIEQIKQRNAATNSNSDEETYKSWLLTPNQFKIWVQTFATPAAKSIQNNSTGATINWVTEGVDHYNVYEFI